MLNVPSVSDEQVETFSRDGCLVLRGALDTASMDLIASWTDELVAMPEASGRQWVFHEQSLKDSSKDLINRIEKISPFHAGFEELSRVLKHSVGQLIGEEAVLFKEKINFKMPGGDGFKPHQDSQAGWDTYANFFVSVLVCIDEATAENGCLQIAAGHHRNGLFTSWEPLSDADMQDMSFVDCPTMPGDIIFFDCFAPHRSDPNMSDKLRRIYFATYNRLSEGDHLEHYYADKHANFPPDIDRDPNKDYVFRV
jgi:2-aminoethylphosphonate dioxygenase